MALTAAQIDVKVTVDGADKAAGQLRSLGTETDNAGKKSQGFWQSATSAAAGFVGGGLILGAIGQLKDFGTSAIGAGLSFEQGIANIGAVTGATGDELKQLSDLALQIGKDTSFGANDATLAIEELAKAGVSTQDILNGAADGATALAAAGGVALPEAAGVMSNALNQFGLSGDQAMHVADLLAGASAASATGVSELGESLKYVGTTAHSLGMPIEDVTTALGLMANQGMVGSMAGTALNQALLSMSNPTEKAHQAMSELGISFTDANNVMKPMPQILSELSTATAGLTDVQRAQYLENIFGVEGGRAMNALLASQTEEAKKAGKSWEDMYASVTKNGVAAQQAAARMDSTMGSIEKLKGSLETLAIIGSMAVLPMFRGLVDGAAHVVDGFTTFITTVQDLIAGGSSPLDAISLAMRGLLTDLFGLDTMNALMPFVDGFLDALEVVGDAIGVFGDLLSGDFDAAILGFAGVLDSVIAGLAEMGLALAGLVVDLVGWTINVGVPAVAGWLADHAGDIWSGIASIVGWTGNMIADLASWTLNVGIPTIASAGWDLLTALGDWLFGGTAPSDGTGGQGYPSQGVAVQLASWILNVGAPTVVMAAWDFATWVLPKLGAASVDLAAWVLNVGAPTLMLGAFTLGALILAELAPLVVDMADWTLNVGFPNVVIAGWDLTGVLAVATNQEVLVPLDQWIVSLSAPEVVLGFGDFAQMIRSKLNLNTAIDVGEVVVAIGLSPFIAIDFATSLPSIILGEVMKAMPDDVKAEFKLTLQLVGAVISSSVDLGLEIVKFATAELAVGLNLSVPLNVTISAINFLGLAADVFNPLTNGLGFKGTIDLIMPDWSWPDLPDWTWPEIPMPGWVGDLIAALGGGSSGGKSGSGAGQTDSGGAAGSAGGGGGAAGAPVQPFTPRGIFDQRPNITTQFDDGGASEKIATLKAALDGLPKSTTLSISQTGGEGVAAAAAIAQAAIAALPPSTSLTISQSGAEGVAASAAIAHAAIAAIPTSHATAITESGGAGVAVSAAIAHAAIAAIPTSHSTSLSIAGAEAVISSANAAAAAIAAIPTSVTTVVSTVTGAARAVGGYVTGGLTRLAELGPELVAMPNGNWFMAMRDALYPTPLGSYVYTAGQTQGMVGSLMPVPAYAGGGYVGGRGSRSGGGGGATFVIHNHFEGDVYGIEEFDRRVVSTTSSVLVDALTTHRRQFGGQP